MKTQSLPNSVSLRARAAIAAGLLSVVALPLHAGLSVTPSSNAAALVNSIVGSGISVVGGTESYSGANTLASGTFSGGNSIGSGGLGIDQGLILTTGYAAGAVGPNNTGSYTGPGATTSLSFDFSSTGGDLFFNYVFASEEYNEWVGSQFNDIFQFILDGNNIALIPSTSTPVTINNVNLGSNSAYFRNNSLSTPPYNIQYDGLTTVFTAQALNLSTGIHHIQLYITDIGDSNYDSAVFIQGNSFSDHPTSTPDSGSTFALMGLGLAALAWARRRIA